MAKQLDGSGSEWPASPRPVAGIVIGAERHPLHDELVASPPELFEGWDQESLGLGPLSRTEEDPAVEMLEMGLLEVD